MVTGFAQGITAAQAFVRIGVEDKVSEALAVVQGKLNVFAANVGRVGASIQRIGLGGGIFGAGIIYGIKKATEESSRATEVNTAYAATFRELTGSAEEFANTLATRFKRDVIDVKDIQRSFFGLFAGQGFERGFSKQAANIFTRLSYDFSSFFNQTVDEAAGRMMSALNNSAEVVQRFGFNVRAPALESAFKDLGINKSIEQATEAEKLIARVMILLQTSGEAQLNIFGDIDRTVKEFANQTRGLQSSITIFLRAIGKPFEEALAPIIGGLAKATMNAANWVSENPKLVAQIGGLTVGLVTGGAALITFGFALRVVAFSLGPIVSLLTSPILLFTRLFDVVGFASGALFHFARIGIGAVVTSLNVLTAVANAAQIALTTVFISSGLLRAMAVIGANAAIAFAVAFRLSITGAMPAIIAAISMMLVNIQIAVGTAVAEITSLVFPVIAAIAVNLQIVIGSAIARILGIAIPVITAIAVNLQIVIGSAIARILGIAIPVISAIALNLQIVIGSAIARIATLIATVIIPVFAMISVRLQIILGFFTALIARFLSTSVMQAVLAILPPILAAVTSAVTALSTVIFASMTATFSGILAAAMSVIGAISAVVGPAILAAIGPVIAILGAIAAKALVLIGIAAAIAAMLYAFRDQIKSVFALIGTTISDFASSATSVFFDFLNGARFVFFDLVAFGKQQFFSLLAIGERTFSALNDAMTAGDFKLAFQIAFAGAKEAAFSFMFDAVDRWGGTIESFVKGLIELKFWFLKTFTEITGFVKLAFDNMESYRQTAVNSISEGIIASLVKVGAVDAEVMQTLKEDIGRQQQSKADAIKAKTAADVATLEGDKQAALGTVNAGVKDFSDGLKRGLRAAQREADALAAKAAGKANAGNLAAANLGELPGVQDLLNQIKSQTLAGSAGEKTMASLKGLDIRSSEGHQSFVDALNNKNSMKGIQDKLSDIEKKLVDVVPKKIGQEFAAEMENQIGVAGLPNQTKK